MQGLIGKYGTAGTLKIEAQEMPIINLPMIDDDAWQELARRNAVDNYRKAFDREPESVEEAVKWQRNKVCSERNYQ